MKKTIVYNNYDLWEDYSEEAKNHLEEESDGMEVTKDAIWNEIHFQDGIVWEDENSRLEDFFTGRGYFLAMGIVGRWNGNFSGGQVFDNWQDMFDVLAEDCDYWKIWDEDGHFYIKCSHHDGTNLYEIKRINEKAYNFIDNWSYNWNDARTEEEIHKIVWESNFLSGLPHYAKSVYGY